MIDNHFKIVIPLYNVEKWIKICLRSVKAQTYKNFQCIILDDLSTDSSVEVIRKEIEGDERFKLIANTEKALALKNIYDGINISNPKAEDIILTLDGDDWLASRDVLEKVNNIYNSSKCWITYGSYAEYPNNRRGKFAKQIPKNIIETNSFRSFEWCSSHLRTFKYHLWERIKKEDLLDGDGNFYKMTWDLAFMFPMLEMSGHRSHYVEEVMYVYNLDNPLNDHKIDNTLQLKLEHEIRHKPKYQKIKILYCYLKGGFANMMFQIAATLSLAADKGMMASFPNLHQQLDYLNDDKTYNPNLKHANEYLKIFENLNILGPTGTERVINFPFYYEEINFSSDDSILEGFFQSEKYFHHNSNEIRDIFKMPEEMEKQIRKKYSQFLDSNTVSLHIRRGDYLKFPDHHVVLSKDYYEKAIKLFPKADFYLVFSDDIEWCKETFKGDKFIFIENEKDYIEFYLMSLCKNNIIANSSFSWWPAWLNLNENKRIVAPNEWFGFKIKENPKDLIPSEWIKI